ncbi:MAG: alanine racemase [Patescibacteria group bacterium]
MKKKESLRTWIEIDTKKLKANYTAFRKLAGKGNMLMAITKSNAYGHGLLDFSRTMKKLGADWLGVDSIVEALAIRKAGIRMPILVLGYTMPERYAEAARAGISVTISNFAALKSAVGEATRSKPLRVHIKIDTGMHRQGFLPDDIAKVFPYFKKKNANLRFEGIYTHFAAAKNPAFPKDTKAQIALFEKVLDAAHEAGFRPIRHATATSGAILFPEAHYDMIRIGIGMYGLWPSKEAEAAFHHQFRLKPILSWKTIISEVKELATGSRVGYDFTEELGRHSVVAICPVGYWHGYPRALSSVGYFIVRGKQAKILGRISMDMIIIDITDIKGVVVGDEATIIGEGITADALAYLADTSNYEIVTRINPLIKRIYK